MLRAWRRVVVLALAASTVIAAQLAGIAPAQAASPTVTIFATSKRKPVTGDVYVIFRAGTFSSATIHGKISGAAPGDVAVLFAQPFPYKKAPVRLNSFRLKTASPVYSFTVTPALATRYSVRLFASGQPDVPLAISQTQNLYIIGNSFWTGGQTCNRPGGRPVCHQTVYQYLLEPASALSLEMAKPLLPYFGLNLGSTNVPPPPKWLYLRGGHATVSKARKISAFEFERTISFSFTINGDSYFWAWLSCLRNTLPKDGVGLPGYHECGASRVLRTIPYLGSAQS